ncbi:MAG: Rieske (2Fe-2S) protein [Mucilaginibacter sp.]
MERNEFLSKLGIGLVTVCAGCSLVGCGSKGGNPKPDPPTNPGGGGGGDKLTANLGTELTSVGQSKIGGGVILVRLAAGNEVSSFTAVQSACTHEGTTIAYNSTQGKFICPLHGSQFSDSGEVLLGPAARPLAEFDIAIDGNTLTVS